MAPPEPKYAAVSVLGVVGSFAIGSLLVRLPGVPESSEPMHDEPRPALRQADVTTRARDPSVPGRRAPTHHLVSFGNRTADGRNNTRRTGNDEASGATLLCFVRQLCLCFQ